MGRLELIPLSTAKSAFEYTTIANYVGTLKDLKFCANREGFIGNIGRVKKADASVAAATGLD